MSAVKYSQLKEGFEVAFENSFGGKASGIVTKISPSKIDVISSTGKMFEWWTNESDIIKLISDKVDKKKFDLIKMKSLVENLRWKGHSLGSDPEFFIEDSKTGDIIPAFDFLPNSENSHGAPFWDGFQAEFNITGGSCLDERVSSFRRLIISLDERAKKHNPRAQLILDSVIEIPESQFDNTDPAYLQFGCSPSFNAYGEEQVELDGTSTRLRTVGGHIHFGLTADNDTMVKYVKALDKILGVACVALFQNYDNPARREYYGRAGEYRLPKHGLEYRTLTNAWGCHPRIMYIVFELARKAIAMEQHQLMHLWDASEEETIECINNCDVNMAKNILMINKDVFKSIIKSFSYQNDTLVNIIFNTFMQGIEALIERPENIIQNWAGDTYTIGRISSIDYSNRKYNYLKQDIDY